MAQQDTIGEFVATLPRAQFIATEYTKVGKVQGRGPDKRRRGNSRVAWSLICGFSYLALCERSLDVARTIDTSELECKTVDAQTAALAHSEVCASLVKSIAGENTSTTDDAFEPLIVAGEIVQGSRVHVESGLVYLQALRIHERTIDDAEPLLLTKSAPKTIAKARLRKRLPIGRYVSMRLTPEQAPRFSFTERVSA